MVLKRLDFHTTGNEGPEMVVFFHTNNPEQGEFS